MRVCDAQNAATTDGQCMEPPSVHDVMVKHSDGVAVQLYDLCQMHYAALCDGARAAVGLAYGKVRFQ